MAKSGNPYLRQAILDVVNNQLRDGSKAAFSGTSVASPQVAGLAAYLWNLSPNRTVAEITDIILRAYLLSPLEGVVDGYSAVLALDDSMDDSPVRKVILDVAGLKGDEALLRHLEARGVLAVGFGPGRVRLIPNLGTPAEAVAGVIEALNAFPGANK